jgi:uncharacterized radical SAM protein YgiQ
MLLPTTKRELNALGWDRPDIILVTGDSYIDSPYVGVALIGQLLASRGYQVGIIAQPAVDSGRDIMRLGEPRLFWGVTGGCVDSMVANYTAIKKHRKSDDYTPGGVNNRRPDRAVIVYSNLIRRYFKETVPIVLGGIEASLRRIAHYDYWSDRIRKSVLFDAKADYLVYGMGEHAATELAEKLQSGADPRTIRGLCYIAAEPPKDFLKLPGFEEVRRDQDAFVAMFKTFYDNNDPVSGQGLCQQQDTRYLVQNPPVMPLTQEEMDSLHRLEFTLDHHPYYERKGSVRALDTIRFSISSHRGCYGECNFCAISVHEGRTVQWRSEQSIVDEARRLARRPDFKGHILDVGGPTANMYGFECERKSTLGSCRHKRCLYPKVCPRLGIDHSPQLKLLRKLRQVEGVKKVFVASGLRHDMVLYDRKHGHEYVEQLARHHVSGQLKLAPEHVDNRVLKLMGKPGPDPLERFKALFDECSRKAGKKQYLTYYFIAAHPGCTDADMRTLRRFAVSKLHLSPEQVQIFTPLPSTWSAVMYYTGRDPFTGHKLLVEKHPAGKQRQKDAVTAEGRARICR